MEKNYDFPPYSPYGMGFDGTMDDMYPGGPMFNPIMQYEQGYMYYRFMCQQLEYKMKLKEFEKLNRQDSRQDRRVE